METLLILILLLIVLDIASYRWGFDSREKLDSPEWERRADWVASYDEHATRVAPPEKVGIYHLYYTIHTSTYLTVSGDTAISRLVARSERICTVFKNQH